MKAKMSYQNKKIAIITVIVLILIAGISIGAYSYFKGNADTEATSSENTTINNETMSEQNSVSEENNETLEETNTTENGSDANSSSDETNSESNNNENTSNNGSNAGTNSSSSNNNSSNNGSNNGSSNNASNNNSNNDANSNENSSSESNDEELPNEEYTQTDYIETGRQILVSESLKVGWMNANLLRDNVSAKIDVVKPTLELNKTAEINSVNAEDNSVQTGSKITYNITVTNTSETVDANNVTVKDTIPEGTSFAEGSIAINGALNSELTDADLARGIDVNVPAGETVAVSFTVVVTAENGEIRNAAVVDGKDTPETVNPVIEANKVATSKDEIVRNGSIISYTITVTNKSNVDAITSVKDTVPEGTTLEKVTTEGSNVNGREISWNNVTLKAGETKTYTFDVKVDVFDGENKIIKNVAVVGNKETPETETEAHYPVISATKSTDKNSVKVGETLTYTITLTNSGIVDGEVKVVDSSPIGTTMVNSDNCVTVSNQEGKTYSEEELNNGIDVIVPAGDTVTVTFTVTVNESAEGSIKNTATIDDGTPTDEENPSVETPVIVTEKTAEVNGTEAAEGTTVKKGDVITYRIKVTNTGSVAGKAIVKDAVPTGTLYNEGSLKIGEGENAEVQTAEEVAKFFGEGLEIGVAPGETVVSFQVTVGNLENNTIIKNVANVNGEPTNETETTYKEAVFDATKTANKDSVKVGEDLEYTITVKNTGSAAGTAIVKDTLQSGVHFKENSNVKVIKNNEIVEEYDTGLLSENSNGIPVELAVDEEAKVTFTVVVDETAKGSIVNKATVNDKETGDEEEPEVETPIIETSKTAEVNETAGLTTAKVGDTIKYTITVKNTGSVEGKAIVKDTVPTGTLYKENTLKVGEEAQNTEEVSKFFGEGLTVDVPANGEVTVTFEVTVTGTNDSTELADGYIIKNKAYVNDTPTDTTETTYQNSNITVVKTSDRTENNSAVVAGDTITYTITATNTGSAEGTVIVRDPIDDEKVTLQGDIKVNDANLVDATISKDTLENDGVTLTVPAKVGETAGTATITFTVKVNEGAKGSISNTAYVKDNEEDKEDPTDPVVDPIITAEKSATVGTITSVDETSVEKNEIITYTIKVKNTGDRIGSVVVKDSAPKGTSFVPGSLKIDGNDANADTEKAFLSDSGLNITINPIINNGEKVIIFQVKVDDVDNILNNGDKIKNKAYVNEIPTNETETTYKEPIINVEKTANKTTVVPGESITYTIKATNTGSAEGTVIVSDTLSEKVTLDSEIVVNDANPENSETVDEATLASGVELTVPAKEGETAGTATITFTVKVKEGVTGSISNTAYVKNDEEDEGDPTDEVETPIITAHKSASVDKVQTGDTITYTITLKNESNINGKVVVKDNKPTGTTFKENSSVIVETSGNEDTLEYTEARLSEGIEVTVPAKGSATVSFTVTVDSNVTAGTTITNIAFVNEEGTEETETTVVAPGIDVTKTITTLNGKKVTTTPVEVEENDIIGYEITVTNTGSIDLYDVTVVDEMANGNKVFTDYDHPENTLKDGIIASNVSLGTTAENNSKTYTVYYKVTANDVATANNGIANTVTATGKYKNNDGTEKNISDDDTETAYAKEVPGISLDKTQSINNKILDDKETSLQVEPGTVINYTIVVSNTGNTVQKDVVVTDTMNNTLDGTPRNATITGVTVNGSTREYSVDGGKISIGDLAVGETATITATYTVQEADMEETVQHITNKATVNKENPDGTTPEDEVEIPTKEWKTNITVSKTGKLEDGTNADKQKVEYGDKITYTLSATNSGTKAGTQKLQDTDLQTLLNAGKVSNVENIVVNDFDENGDPRESSDATYQNIIDGITVNVPAGKTATVTFTVTVTAKPGETISNAVVGNEDKPVISTVHDYINVKSNTGKPADANYILIIDTSSSMTSNKVDDKKTTRFKAAVAAIKDLAKFLFADDTETESKLSIVQFNREAETVSVGKQIVFGKEDYDNGRIKTLIDNITTHSGTNIEEGLKEAGDLLYGSEGIHAKGLTDNTKDILILLSDGEPYQGEKNPDGLGKIARQQLNRKGEGITNEIYSIAFGKDISKDTLQAISPNKVYSSSNQADLFKTFKNIVYEAGKPVEVELNSTSQTIYTGEQQLADDQKITITYDGLDKAKEYTFTQPGTSSDGILTYLRNSNGTYSLVFNYKDELLGKKNITITYYVK